MPSSEFKSRSIKTLPFNFSSVPSEFLAVTKLGAGSLIEYLVSLEICPALS
nr:MAG TPA: hypothetical protein [Caudoviricetes sp.]